MKKLVAVGVALVVVVVATVVMTCGREADEGGGLVEAVQTESVENLSKADEESDGEDAKDADVEYEAEGPQTEEEKLEAEEEKKVDDFDNLTDKWMEPTKSGISMKDIDEFAKTFRAVPKERQNECVHRALNLIPDENVMLLAGLLMDKSMDREIVETVFNDILNRDEDVKLPILREIFKDKTHPCWADVAWILDVTGEIKK